MKRPDITSGEWMLEASQLQVFGTSDIYGPNLQTLAMLPVTNANPHNARAIAALPDLLEALEWCLELLTEQKQHPLTQLHIKNALTKAGYTFDA